MKFRKGKEPDKLKHKEYCSTEFTAYIKIATKPSKQSIRIPQFFQTSEPTKGYTVIMHQIIGQLVG